MVLAFFLGLFVFEYALKDVLLIRSGVRIGDCVLVVGGDVDFGYSVVVLGVCLAWLWFVCLERPVLY